MPILERDAYVDALAAGLALAAQGSGRIVLCGGEAGIGKTALVERFMQQHAGTRTLWGSCEALATPHPLGPVHDLARAAGGRLKALLAADVDRATLFAGVLDELAIAAPTLLVIEDVHWADAATLDLVKFLGRRIERVPALMLLTYRDDDHAAIGTLRSIFGQLPARQVIRIALPPLSHAAVATLAAAAQRSDAGLHAATEGNPFFVTEVLAARDPGLPASVRDAVLGRAADLAPAARAVLDVAAIVPRAVEAALVDRILGPTADAVAACISSGLLLAEGPLLRFRHELARMAVAEALPAPLARQLHAAALAALAATPVALARLVHHANLANDADAVLRLAPLAAREAAARGARREAAAHCRMALAHATTLPVGARADLLHTYAEHCFELNELTVAIAARSEAIAGFDAAGDVPRQVAALAAHAIVLVRALRNADADAASRAAITLAETLPPGQPLAHACATYAYLRMLNRDYAEAITWGRKAVALADAAGDESVRAAACIAMGAALLFVDYAQGAAMLLREVDAARAAPGGDARVADAYVMLGSAAGELFAFTDAQRHLQDGIAFARAHDLDRLAGYMDAWLALVDLYAGRWDAAGERANALLASERTGSTSRLMALVALGRMRSRRGDPGAATVLDEAQALSGQTGTLQRIAPVCCARAEAAWLVGDVAATRDAAQAAFALAQQKAHPWFTGEMAYWLWKAGALQQPPAACAAPYQLEIAGEWQAAAAAWHALYCPYESARALAGGDADAQRAALAALDRMGAKPLANRVREALRQAGIACVPRGPRATTRDNAAGLTVREMEVLELVATGCSNAAIAVRLSRSPRTVEHHLAAILAKLDARSRSDAVAIAARLGLLAQNG